MSLGRSGRRSAGPGTCIRTAERICALALALPRGRLSAVLPATLASGIQTALAIDMASPETSHGEHISLKRTWRDRLVMAVETAGIEPA